MLADARRPGPAGRFAIIGLGRIGRRLATRLPGTPQAPALAAVLVRPAERAAAVALLGAETVCTEFDAFLEHRPDVAVECASPAALAEIGPAVLAAGIDLMPLSLAAFVDHDVARRLTEAAAAGPGRIEIPPGALGSLGFLAAAREDELRRVVFRVAYPVARWRATAADGMIDLDSVRERAVFFRGSVREGARMFPRHVNVSVGVALAGLGLDRTEVELIADPSIGQPAYELEVMAGPGALNLRIHGRDLPSDQDPVDYTTFGVMHLLRRRQARVAI